MQSTAASNECDGDKGNAAFSRAASTAELALTGLEAAFGLVDDVNPALAANQPVVAVTAAQGFQRITDLHGTMLSGRPRCRAEYENRWLMGISRRPKPRETGGFYAIGDTNVNPIRQIQAPATGSNCPEWNPISDFPRPKCLSNQTSRAVRVPVLHLRRRMR